MPDLLTGDQYIELLLERQAAWERENPATANVQPWVRPLLDWFVREGDERLVHPEVLKRAPQPKRAPTPIPAATIRAKRDRVQMRLDQAHTARARAERLAEAATEARGGLNSFGGSGPQTAARKVRSMQDRAYRAISDAEARIERWTAALARYDARLAKAEAREQTSIRSDTPEEA